MKIVSFTCAGDTEPRTGALLSDGSEVLDFTSPATAIPAPATHLGWFDLDGVSLREARSLVEAVMADDHRLDALRKKGAVLPRGHVHLEAPVVRPGKVLCIGLNYKDHAAESGMTIPEVPLLFSKFPTSVTPPGSPVQIPVGSTQVDYEAELAVVIGRRAFGVPAAEGLDYVLGYTNINDVSARDFQFADGQWQRGKSCDTFAPLGEFIATTDEVPDPQRLAIRFRLNGETMQDSNTCQMAFTVAVLVAELSKTITLEPGDVIATGTPPGVGFARKPPIYVKDGDLMEVEVEGLGVLANPVQG